MATIKLVLKTILYRPLFNALIFLVWLIPGHNIAWAIIALTIIVRLILLPSSVNATRAQRRMRDIQPKLQKLQAQYKDDKQKQSQALMAFYKENKVNPLGSCLPLLIQFPILIVLYYVFIHGLNTNSFYLLYHFTPHPSVINTIWLGFNMAKPDRWILPIIAGILQFIQGRQLLPPKPKDGSSADPASLVSSQMMYLMPLITVFIAGRLPSALPLYWIITTLFAIGQQWWVMREPAANFESPSVKLSNETSIIENIEKKTKDISKTIKHGVEVTVRKKK
ncbi:MAG: YidC/Oxa1 family membrane protein insertase [Patescibacteria group bacterium]